MIPKSTANTLVVASYFYDSTQPFRHRQFIGKLIVVDDPTLLYLHNRLMQASSVGESHLVGTTSSHLSHT